MPAYQFHIFADDFQINLKDERFARDIIDWNNKAIENLFAVGERMMTMGTARNMTLPVTVEVRDDTPPDDFENWDQVNEDSIEIPSDCLIIRGCTDASDTAPKILKRRMKRQLDGSLIQ
ncbi:MAG: hypothetical protein AB1757_02485 [Acidobacteriota bacterium]